MCSADIVRATYYYTMCSYCKDTLIRGFVQIKHDPQACPLLQARYCSICSTNGHTTSACPDEAVLQFRKPHFVEQLIPSSLLKQYSIKSRTPIGDFVVDEKKLKGCLEVQDNEKHIRAILSNHNVVPSHKVKENRALIIALAARLNRKIVFIKSDGIYVSPEENETNASQEQKQDEAIPKKKATGRKSVDPSRSSGVHVAGS